MIVRDEEAIIQQCLESVKPYIDCWVIVDTGSTDNTPNVIENFMHEANIPGELHHEKFVDFSTTRNFALEKCRASDLQYEYILLIDADMELIVSDLTALNTLNAPAYKVEQYNSISYYNTRIILRDTPSMYKGVTHEYLWTTHDALRLAGVSMADHANGSNRKHKIMRDISLLTNEIKNNPSNLRNRFYLAQTLRDAKKYEEALGHYRIRSVSGGWEEEAWYSEYQASRCLYYLGRKEEFEVAALKCWERRPQRAEPLALLVRHYREVGNYNEAFRLGSVGKTIKYPDSDSLFIELAVYKWFFDQELAVSGYYTNRDEDYAIGKHSCESLITNPDAPSIIREHAKKNLQFYLNSSRLLT